MKSAIVALCIGLLVSVTGVSRELVVSSTDDSGTGTLRWALQTARSGDVITFDPAVFPPEDPATIYVTSTLPPVVCGHLTIDASDAGVIMDGDHMPETFAHGLEIYSDENAIMGLQIVRFVGAGLAICSGSRNTIGGDRSIGAGPAGQGNTFSGNGMGIDLCDAGTSGNALLGNLIGVDSDRATPFGNEGSGIFIEPGVIDSRIGPGNIIAHNHVCGVEIFGATSLRNTIAGNAIFANEQGGISLLDGGNGLPEAPSLAIVDLAGGLIEGTADPESVVELFSDEADQGKTIEATAVADDRGVFSIEIGRSLTGPYVTATATLIDGSTSPFSVPFACSISNVAIQTTASGLQYPIKVQEGRANQFTTGLWSGLWQADAYSWDLDQLVLTEMLPMGSTSVRLAVNSLDAPTVNSQEPEWPIADHFDQWIVSLSEHGISIRFGLSFWDKAGNAADRPPPCERFTTERDIERYLEFVRNVVTHFADHVDSFELWNEPNVPTCWQNIPVERYVDLVRRVTPIVRAHAPNTEIVIGSVTPFIDCEGYQYLRALIDSDVLPLVDAISWHVGGPSPEFGEWREIYATYPELMRTAVEAAQANGFTGRFIADELNWRSNLNPHPYGGEPWAYTPATAAKYYARGTLTNLGLGFDVGYAELSIEREPVFSTVQNLCRTLRSAESVRFEVLMNVDTEEPVAYCAFRYPNGDRILAVWTDGIAQDEDPGVPATATFPDMTAGCVTGIDVLHGFEQELVFEIENGDTIVRDLLVKDYPILIRLSDIAFAPDYEETVGDGFHRMGEPSEY